MLSLSAPTASEGRGCIETESAEGVEEIAEEKPEGQKRAGQVKREQKKMPSLVIPFVERRDDQNLAIGVMFGATGMLVKVEGCPAGVLLRRRSEK